MIKIADNYDVIIVGAGPAGLNCAYELSRSKFSVLIVEKKEVIGPKICAGGLTLKDLAVLDIPEKLIEVAVDKATLFSPRFKAETKLNKPFVFTVNRKDLGQWQLALLKNTSVKIKTGTKVTAVNEQYIETNRGEKIGYKYLVGADGPSSLVRRYLKLPVRKQLVTFQYRIPWNDEPRFEIYLDSRYFNSWYAWVFPHKKELVAGCGADPKMFSPKKLKQNFHHWLEKNNFDITRAKYESFPINYDFRGFRFGRIFLAGEAAGLSSGLTGEGIFQALVSGKEVAKTIMNPGYHSTEMEQIIRYNGIQEKILKFFRAAGPLRNLLFNITVRFMQTERFNRRVTKGFAGA